METHTHTQKKKRLAVRTEHSLISFYYIIVMHSEKLLFILCLFPLQEIIKSEQDKDTEKDRLAEIEKEKQKQREEYEELESMLFGEQGKQTKSVFVCMNWRSPHCSV